METDSTDRDRPTSFLHWGAYLALFGGGTVVLVANLLYALIYGDFDSAWVTTPLLVLCLTGMVYRVDARATAQIKAMAAQQARAWDDGYALGVHDQELSQDWTGGRQTPARANPYLPDYWEPKGEDW